MPRLLFSAFLVVLLAISAPTAAQENYDTLPTGPKIGALLAPALEGATDHKGTSQTLKTLRGKKGLILLFSRSFDW